MPNTFAMDSAHKICGPTPATLVHTIILAQNHKDASHLAQLTLSLLSRFDSYINLNYKIESECLQIGHDFLICTAFSPPDKIQLP